MATHSSILAWGTPWTGYSPWGLKESDILKMNNGIGYVVQCTTTSVCLMPLNCILEMVTINTCHVYLTRFKKI